MSVWQTISKHISATTGETFAINKQQGVGGGCINETQKVSDGTRSYFVKINHISHGDMFEAEARGLEVLAGSHTVKVPEPVCYGNAGQQCYLVMEYLNLSGRANMPQFARQFAALHRITDEQFGWFRNNTIGSTPQINTQYDNWCDFWRENRLGYQLNLARSNGYGGNYKPWVNA